MGYQSITLEGRDYLIVPREEFDRMASQKTPAIPLPSYPPADANGNMPAVAFGRVSIARTVITRMNTSGVSAAEFAKLAGVPRSTLNYILKGTRTADAATLNKIEKALLKFERTVRKTIASA